MEQDCPTQVIFTEMIRAGLSWDTSFIIDHKSVSHEYIQYFSRECKQGPLIDLLNDCICQYRDLTK